MKFLFTGRALLNRWWSLFSTTANFAYDLVNQRYMRRGSTTSLALSLSETRASPAWVLQGNGVYDEIASGELAIGQGVGLQVSEEYVNEFVESRRITALNSNTPAPVAYTGTTPFGDVGGRVYTSTGHIQTNSVIVADSSAWTFSRYFKPLSAGARFTSAGLGINGVDSSGVVYDFDTMSTISGQAPSFVETLGDGWVRLSWVFQNDGTGTILVWREDVDGLSDYASDQTDIVQGDFPKPPIITTGTEGTRAADNPVVIQGFGEELYNSSNLVTPGGYDTTHIVTPTGFDAVMGTSDARIAVNLSDVIIGATHRVEFGPLPASVGCFAFTEAGGSGSVLVSETTTGATSISFVPTTSSMSILFAKELDGFSITDLSVKQVFPYPGYNTDGTLSGDELVTGGGFDTQADVDAWAATNATKALSTGRMRLTNTIADFGFAHLSTPSTEGRVYRVTGERSDKDVTASIADVHVGAFENSTAYASNAEWSAGPFVFLSQYDDVRITAIVGGNTLGAWKEFDNISLQEVEPGVVVEVEGVWGDVVGQRGFLLNDGGDTNFVEARRASNGNITLQIVKDSISLFNSASDTAWPDNTEATFRLELTNTDGGCFAAVFLDDVFVISCDAFDYPEAVNQLSLAPIAGTTTVKQVLGK